MFDLVCPAPYRFCSPALTREHNQQQLDNKKAENYAPPELNNSGKAVGFC